MTVVADKEIGVEIQESKEGLPKVEDTERKPEAMAQKDIRAGATPEQLENFNKTEAVSNALLKDIPLILVNGKELPKGHQGASDQRLQFGSDYVGMMDVNKTVAQIPQETLDKLFPGLSKESQILRARLVVAMHVNALNGVSSAFEGRGPNDTGIKTVSSAYSNLPSVVTATVSPASTGASNAPVVEQKQSFASTNNTEGKIEISVKLSSSLREQSVLKESIDEFDGDIDAAREMIINAENARAEAHQAYKSAKAAEDSFVTKRDSFDQDVSDMSGARESEAVVSDWKRKIIDRHGEILTDEEKAAIQAATSIKGILDVCIPILAVDGRLDQEIKKLQGATDAAVSALDQKEAAQIEANKKAEELVIKANDDLNSAISGLLKDPANAYLRDLMRANSQGEAVVPFRDESLRVTKERAEDSIAAILGRADLSPTLKRAVEEQRMLSEEELKSLSKEERGLAKLVALLAVYQPDGKTKIQDKDVTLLEGMYLQQDAAVAGNDRSANSTKLYNDEIMKALNGLVTKGIVDKDGNVIRDTKKLAEHWGVSVEAVRHLHGSIDEGYFRSIKFAGVDSASPEVVARLASETSRLLLDRTDRKPWYGQLNTQDGIAALLGILVPIKGVGPLGTGALQVAARRERSGILGLAITAYSLVDRLGNNTGKTSSGGNNGGGNGNGSGEP